MGERVQPIASLALGSPRRVTARRGRGCCRGCGVDRSSTPDTDCLRAGQAVLRSLDAFPAAARGEVDYAAFDQFGTGDIRTELGDEAFLPLSTVFQLRLRSPEQFSWCD